MVHPDQGCGPPRDAGAGPPENANHLSRGPPRDGQDQLKILVTGPVVHLGFATNIAHCNGRPDF